MDCCDHDHDEMDYLECAKVGQKIRHFSMEAYDPAEGGFAVVDSEKILKKKKWLVLVFYPADFTFVCPTELADLAAQHARLKKLGAEVVSVSTDTKYAHLAWRTSERLLQDVKFLMAADPAGHVSRFFDVWDGESGLALRGTFIINPEGVLVSSEVNFYNVGRNADELVRKLEANVHLMKHPNEACPAKWTPGAKTLAPSEALVGKVYEALNEN
ncbi:peroxiredoxin (alkyl hydroperoxide reductase subunit C) [Humidesulfovibrio mexicanus]|uniref:Alkyl hydroperoxide reductase C n=1 Tax=Humidesulfovibrio mexicanus TaxID=147047 RepID=A0A238ZZ58_9BACT|nr:redoxin domain-containing protein [Humidesulfovibrio mexicanus]SNR88432.1 peroxiredoxin (alkyl hydroperoxide reductase subunit C) [Humidesulfovibrio mexicanus]